MSGEANKVIDLQARKPTATGNEGLGVVLEVAIGKGQNLQFSTCLAQADPLSVWNEQIDKMRKAGERQSLIAGIVELDHAITAQQREIQHHLEEDQIHSETYAKSEIERFAKIDEFNAQIAKAKTFDEERFQGSQRRGDYKMSPDTKATTGGLESRVRQLREDADKAEETRKEQVRDLTSAINSMRKRIGWNQAEIDKANKKLDDLKE